MTQAIETSPIIFTLNTEEIEAKRARFAALSAETTKGYNEVRGAIAECRTMRLGIEATRKELKASALEYGRKVDLAAKELTALIAPFEDDLKAKKQAVDDEKARIKREKVEAEFEAMRVRVEAERAAAEAESRAKREAEEAKLAAEREQLERERAEIKAAQDQLAAEQLEADRRFQELAVLEQAHAPVTAAETIKENPPELVEVAPPTERRPVLDDDAPPFSREEEDRIIHIAASTGRDTEIAWYIQRVRELESDLVMAHCAMGEESL